MAYRDDANTLNIKVVYYGPALSGKTTNIIMLHELSGGQKGEIMIMETQGDRTLFFDAFPLGLTAPGGLRIKVKLYTVPGQVAHNSTRKAILSRADGICFVADSQPRQAANNSTALENLLENMKLLGMDPESTPLCIQFNKRDLPDVMHESALLDRWRETPWSDLCFASALHGEGVIETFRSLMKKVFKQIDSEFGLSGSQGLGCESFVNLLTAGEAA